jgi:YD repeat-containing protein
MWRGSFTSCGFTPTARMAHAGSSWSRRIERAWRGRQEDEDFVGASFYAYNAESEVKTAAGVTYTYDGDGNRVEKSNGKIYWYGAGTEILDESDTSGNFSNEYVFFCSLAGSVAMRVVSSGPFFMQNYFC